ncbi:MAG: hypothetical protein AAFU73_04295 [Planctomycetota bacterium]
MNQIPRDPSAPSSETQWWPSAPGLSRARNRATLAASAAIFGLAASAQAQFTEPQADIRAFGMRSWMWVSEVPHNGSTARLFWSAEDGGRIRFLDERMGAWSPARQVPDATNLSGRHHQRPYRDLVVFQPDQAIDQWCGVAVGDRGQYAWAMGDLMDIANADLEWNELDPAGFNPTNPFGVATNSPDIWDVEVTLDPACAEAGEAVRIWLVGDDHTIGYTTALMDPLGTAGPTPVSPSPFVVPDFPLGAYPNVNSTTADLRGIAFSEDGRNGILVGDNVAYYTRDCGDSWLPCKFKDTPAYEVNGPNPDPAQFIKYPGVGRSLELWDAVLYGNNPDGPNALIVGGIAVESGQFIYGSSDGGATFVRERSAIGRAVAPEPEFQQCSGLPADLDCPPPGPTGLGAPPGAACWDLGDTGRGAVGNQPSTHNLATLYAIRRRANGEIFIGGYTGAMLRRAPGATGLYEWENISQYCRREMDPSTVWSLTGVEGGSDVNAVGAWGMGREWDDNAGEWTDETGFERWRLRELETLPQSGGDDRVYAVGQQLRIARSDDSGRTWSLLQGEERWRTDLHGSEFLDVSVFDDGPGSGDDVGVAVGFMKNTAANGDVTETPIIYYTLDGGPTGWLEATLPNLLSTPGPPGSPPNVIVEDKVRVTSVAHNPDAVAVGDANHPLVFAATTSLGQILRSVDGGATWTNLGVPSGVGRMTDVSMVSSAIVFCASGDGGNDAFALTGNFTSTSPLFANAVGGALVAPKILEVKCTEFYAAAVGDDGSLWTYQRGSAGSGFFPVSVPAYSNVALRSLSIESGVAVNPRIVIGGAAGLLYEYQGGVATRMHSATSVDIRDIGRGSSGFYLMGTDDTTFGQFSNDTIFSAGGQTTITYLDRP